MNKTMKEESKIIEFLTNEGVEIQMIKRNRKYNILVSDEKKKIKTRKVFETLDTEIAMNQFFKFCNFFTKELK